MTHPRFSPTQRRRAVLSSYLGSLIEYYDFLLYATASAVVFNRVFFSDLDPLVGTVAAFGTLATGYLARPLGGIVFGHFGDRVGRKKMLVISMVLMGVASTLIGVLPTYAQVGALAPVLLIVLRVVQGVAVGGEWGGAVLMSAEHASSRRGLWASFTNAGAPSGMVLSTLVLALSAGLTGDAFLTWGWRIPFLLSVVLLGIGLFVRLSVTETPVFAAAAASSATPARAPLFEVLSRPRNLLLAVGVGFGAFVAQGTLTTFLISYAVGAGFERQTVLNALTASSVVAILGIIGFSALSDRVGRRPVVLGGAVATGLWCIAIFPMIDTGSAVLLTLAVVVGQGVTHAAWFGPSAALYSEMFSTGSRYTGASLGYQISGMGAGLSPVLFASLQAAGFGTGVLSAVIVVLALVSVASVLALRETARDGLTGDPATAPAPGAPASAPRP
ncbi:MFS transporter [Pseudonocardia spirodelae]|uniref:MFS transporter n=1 Tax=Pseudonocardia spirodelae TaxID=3133431 RepID=A0ABU8TCH2_9PSEU